MLKIVSLFIAFSSALPALAAVEFPSVVSVKVFRPFQVRRIDGRVITIKPESNEPPDLRALPAPRGADETLCGDFKSENVDRLMNQTNRMIQLSRLARLLGDENRKRLSSSEAALIESTPRCQPFLPFLAMISEAMGAKSAAKEYEVSQLKFEAEFLRSPALELMLDDWALDEGSKVQFTMPGMRAWGPASVPSSSTGRAIGVDIEDLGEGEILDGGDGVYGRENCTAADGRPGRRYYHYDPDYHYRNWRITFSNGAGQRLMEIMATTSKAVDNGSSSECRAFHGRGRR